MCFPCKLKGLRLLKVDILSMCNDFSACYAHKVRQALMSLHKCELGRDEKVPSSFLDQETNPPNLLSLDYPCSTLTTELVHIGCDFHVSHAVSCSSQKLYEHDCKNFFMVNS